MDGKRKYQMLLKAEAKHAWPMWSADGKMLFYMSGATGAENIWAVPVASPESAKELTRFREGRVLWPSSSCWRRNERRCVGRYDRDCIHIPRC
jgi:Tol biopolymer transport system component